MRKLLAIPFYVVALLIWFLADVIFGKELAAGQGPMPLRDQPQKVEPPYGEQDTRLYVPVEDEPDISEEDTEPLQWGRG